MKLVLLFCLLAAPALASEPLPPPKVVTAPCPPKAQAAPVVIVTTFRRETLAERILRVRAERAADRYARRVEMAGRGGYGVLWMRVGVVGGCR